MEHEIIQTAKQLLVSKETEFLTFEMRGINALEEASICGGRTRVLLEWFTPEIQDDLLALDPDNMRGSTVVLLTTISRSQPVTVERRWLRTGDDIPMAPVDFAPLYDTVMRTGKHATQETEAAIYCLYPVSPPAVLHIFGAGHVGLATAKLAEFIELDSMIYDDRADLANSTRFPNALAIVTDPVDSPNYMSRISPTDYAVVATRGHQHDLSLMSALLARDVSYLGLVSSKTKWFLLAKQLRLQGFDDRALKRVHAPIGLDIASQTVPEIAVSIIAEIINHSHGRERTVLSLSRKTGSRNRPIEG